MEKNLSDELKEISSGLLRKHEADVPEGYFESFPDQVISEWKNQRRSPETGVIKLRKMVAAAAVVTGICITIGLSSNGLWNSGMNNEITASEAYEYILENIEEFEPLMEAPLRLAEQSDFEILETAEIEDYLLEEMKDSGIEQIF